MPTRQPRYSMEEHARRGTELYERQIRPHVEGDHFGKIVAIDIETGAYEIADNSLNASQRLLSQNPDAQIWCVRVGHRGVHRFGLRAIMERA